MDHQFCPGATLLRRPVPEIFDCPSCHGEVEIWTDEFKGYVARAGWDIGIFTEAIRQRQAAGEEVDPAEVVESLATDASTAVEGRSWGQVKTEAVVSD